MHGLVNRSLQCFLRDTYGTATWERVAQTAGVGPEGFEAMLRYDDRVFDRTLDAAARVLERPGMTEARLDALLERQLPDTEKRSRADFVVDTGGTLADTEAQLDTILAALRSRPAHAYERHWL